MEKVKVEFETITPIFTGDAWGKNSEIKASSVMGSLRFWFEVYCHFTGIDVKEKEELKDKDYQRILQNLKKDIDDGKDIDDIDKYIFDRLPLTLSSKIFGCTGWKSQTEIESIRYLDDYCFGNRLNLPSKIIPSKNWFFAKPYFFGKFEVIFKVNSIVLNDFLFLLSFMNDYGYIGGKNNIGYGRVKIDKLIIDNKNHNLEVFKNRILQKYTINLSTQSFNIIKEILGVESFYCQTERDFDNKVNNLPQKVILLVTENTQNQDYQHLTEQLIEKKIKLRNCLRHNCEKIFKEKCFENKKFKKDNEIECNDNKKIKCQKFYNISPYKEWKNFRHYIFGTTSGESNATKVIPYFNAIKNNDQWKINEYGFLSIVGIKTFGERNE